MTTRRAVALLLGLGVLLLVPMAAGAQIGDAVTVAISPTDNPVVLGESFEVTIDVTNNGGEATPPLVIHIDITDPRAEGSVDPEDWTSTLSKAIGEVDAGATRTLTWRLQPISRGTFSLYAVALSPGVDNTTVSNIVTVDVADRRSLDPGGILPVAVAAPAITGGLLALQTRRRRRSAGSASSMPQTGA